MQTDSIVMFRNQLEALRGLTSMKDVKIVVRAIIEYGMNGKEDIDMPEHLLFGWNAIKFQIDTVIAAREQKLESYRERGRRGQAAVQHKRAEVASSETKPAQAISSQHKRAEASINNNNKENNNILPPNINIAPPADELPETQEPPLSYKQWSIDDFTASVDEAINNHPEYADHRDAFLRYWSEPDPKGRMRFALQKTWLTAGRLATWARNNNNNWNAGERNDGNNGCNKPGSEGSFGRYVPRNG